MPHQQRRNRTATHLDAAYTKRLLPHELAPSQAKHHTLTRYPCRGKTTRFDFNRPDSQRMNTSKPYRQPDDAFPIADQAATRLISIESRWPKIQHIRIIQAMNNLGKLRDTLTRSSLPPSHEGFIVYFFCPLTLVRYCTDKFAKLLLKIPFTIIYIDVMFISAWSSVGSYARLNAVTWVGCL